MESEEKKYEFRSKFFARFDVHAEENQQFKSHLASLISLEFPEVKMIIGAMQAIVVPSHKGQTHETIEKLGKETGRPESVITNSVRALLFFTQNLLDKDVAPDNLNDWVKDLTECGLVPPEKSDALQKIFEELQARAENLEPHLQKRFYSKGVLPSFRKVGATVEIRAVQKDQFSPGDKLATYNSNITGLVPVASIILIDDFENEFGFQISESDLEYLIDYFGATLQDLKKLEIFIEATGEKKPETLK